MTWNELASKALEQGRALDFRGDGKAGGGLVLAMQAFGAALSRRGDLDVQDWPLFSSARKGANVRAFLRVAQREVQSSCLVTRPDVVVLMNEAAAAEIDFAEGTNGALYVVNSADSPEAIAERYHLGGTIATIAGDDLGRQFLDRPLGNVAIFATLVKATGLVGADASRISLEKALRKRRLPERLVSANLALFDAAIERSKTAVLPISEATGHGAAEFRGYGLLPVGAQSGLRTARRNRTSGYGRPGVKVEFRDPTARCNGCSLCVVQCPEGIIDFTADPSRGAIVHGARFDDYCKACRECVTACPLDLFSEVMVVARPAGAVLEG